MKNVKRILLLSLCVIIVPLIAWSQERDRATKDRMSKITQWKKHANHYARLKQNAQYYFALPDKRRQALNETYKKLQKLPAHKQAELLNTMERYVSWLERLKPEDRQRIAQAKSNRARLKAIHAIRDKQWVRKQSKAIRLQLKNLDPAAKAKKIRMFRKSEQNRRQLWKVLPPFWKELYFAKDGKGKRRPMPGQRADLAKDVQDHLDYFLLPLLSKSEKRILEDAEKRGWPWYPMTLVRLAGQYPMALRHASGPKQFSDLPLEVRKKLRTKGNKVPMKLRVAQGQYPAFIVALTKYADDKNIVIPNEYWPYNAKGLSRNVREFVQNKLIPLLSDGQHNLLRVSEGKWKEYTETLQKLARTHNLRIPWQTLPGSQVKWDKYRYPGRSYAHGFLVVPRHQLREFALFELTPRERADLRLWPYDPGTWQRLSQEYFKRNQKKFQHQQDMEEE